MEQIKLLLSSQEKEQFSELWEKLQEDCKISPKRQSELIIEGFFQYAKQLLSSRVNHTHTNPQSFTKQRKDAIFNLVEQIKEKGYIWYAQSYSELILLNECFFNVKSRTKSSYFQDFLQSEDLYYINLPYYYDTESKSAIIIIHKQSKWWPQLQDLCSNNRKPLLKVTSDNKTDEKLKYEIFQVLKSRTKFKTKLDRVERIMLNVFLFEIGQIGEKPIYDQTDLVLKEVIQLRSSLNFTEASELLEKEKEHNRILNDSAIKCLEPLK